MATKRTHDLAVVVGTYQKDGQTKNRYLTIGAMMQKDDGGKFIIMERSFNLSGLPYDASKGNSVMVSLFDVNRNQTGSAPAADDEDTPF